MNGILFTYYTYLFSAGINQALTHLFFEILRYSFQNSVELIEKWELFSKKVLNYFYSVMLTSLGSM